MRIVDPDATDDDLMRFRAWRLAAVASRWLAFGPVGRSLATATGFVLELHLRTRANFALAFVKVTTTPQELAERRRKTPHAFVRGPDGPDRLGPPDETCALCQRDSRNIVHRGGPPK